MINRLLLSLSPMMLDYTFPAGTTYWLNPIIISGQTGLTMKGQRNVLGLSRMVYRGAPTIAPIQFIGCTRCNLLDLEVVDESGCDATVLVTNAVDPPNQGYSTANRISNVRVLLSGNGKASRRAFSVDSTAAGGQDGNNDHHTFDRCRAESYTEAGFYVKGSQSHDHLFTQCQAHDAGGRKPIGFHAAGAVFFEWHRGAMNSNSDDFKLDSPETQAVVLGHNSENSLRFMTANFQGECCVRATDVRWEGKPGVNRPVLDGSGPGPWSITNSFFSGTNGNCPTISIRGPTPGSIDLSGVIFRQYQGAIGTVPIVSTSTTLAIRQHGLVWQRVNENGSRTTKRITVNQAGVP